MHTCSPGDYTVRVSCLSCITGLCLLLFPLSGRSDTGVSTRVEDPQQHVCTSTTGSGYPYRENTEFVLGQLDLKPGDVVVDIGAGDGWWSKRMADEVGEQGAIHAAEVEEKKVEQMKKSLADWPQIEPYLCPTDGTGLAENSCDLAFLSKTYHHLNEGSHVDYLRHLRKVLKPTGRVCVIEKYPEITPKNPGHAWTLSRLIAEAEQAGWIPVRCELMTGTYHYMAIFVQQDLFPTPKSDERGRGGRRNRQPATADNGADRK